MFYSMLSKQINTLRLVYKHVTIIFKITELCDNKSSNNKKGILKNAMC